MTRTPVEKMNAETAARLFHGLTATPSDLSALANLTRGHSLILDEVCRELWTDNKIEALALVLALAGTAGKALALTNVTPEVRDQLLSLVAQELRAQDAAAAAGAQ